MSMGAVPALRCLRAGWHASQVAAHGRRGSASIAAQPSSGPGMATTRLSMAGTMPGPMRTKGRCSVKPSMASKAGHTAVPCPQLPYWTIRFRRV